MNVLFSTIGALMDSSCNDLDKLVDELHIRGDFNILEVKARIKFFLSPLRESISVVIESDYVDRVYRDMYYNYYSTERGRFNKNTLRLSLFDAWGDGFDKAFYNRPFLSRLQNVYLGYIVLRPITSCIGRNVVSPLARKDRLSGYVLCSTTVPSSCIGVKLEAKGFPHSSQDGQMTVCAETSLWEILEYFGTKYDKYSPVLPSHIHNAISSLTYQRDIPSDGLTVTQLSLALRKFGFGSKIYSNSYPNLQEIFTCYIESGIPIIVCLSNSNINHAIVCIGRRNIQYGEISQWLTSSISGKNYLVWNENVNDFVFNDDNMPCYQTSTYRNIASYYLDPLWDNCQVSYVIAPLHEKVYIDAVEAIQISKYLIANMLNCEENSLIRTFLTSTRSFKEYIMFDSGLSDDDKDLFCQMDMPKFVWVTEISRNAEFLNGKYSSLVVLDATARNSASNSMGSLITIVKDGYVKYYDAQGQEIEFNIGVSQLNVFTNNLKQIV